MLVNTGSYDQQATRRSISMLTSLFKTPDESSLASVAKLPFSDSAFSLQHFIPFDIGVFLLELISTALPSALSCLALLCSPFSWCSDPLSLLHHGHGPQQAWAVEPKQLELQREMACQQAGENRSIRWAGAQRVVQFAREQTCLASRDSLWALLTFVIRDLDQLPTWVPRIIEGDLDTPPGLQPCFVQNGTSIPYHAFLLHMDVWHILRCLI